MVRQRQYIIRLVIQIKKMNPQSKKNGHFFVVQFKYFLYNYERSDYFELFILWKKINKSSNQIL